MYNGRRANQQNPIQPDFAPHTGVASERPVERIVVARPGALGDTLLTFPALALLRRWAPQARLSVIARADTLPLLRANGLADDTESWDLPDWAMLFAEEASAHEMTPHARTVLVGADVGVVWANDSHGTLSHRLAELGIRRGIVAPALQPADAPEPIHAAVWLASALGPLGVAQPALTTLASLTAPLRPPADDGAHAAALWRDWGLAHRTVVALHPGSGSQAKRWPAERFAKVARLACDAGYTPLLFAGEADTLALEEVQAALSRLDLTVAVARDLRVGVLVAALALCAGYVGNDSGVSHLAALTGVPTVAVFGPTDPARWAPLGPRASALRAPDRSLASIAADAAWKRLLTQMLA